MKTRNPTHPRSPKSRKTQRRIEAEARQEYWNSLSLDEKIAQLEARGELGEAETLRFHNKKK